METLNKDWQINITRMELQITNITPARWEDPGDRTVFSYTPYRVQMDTYRVQIDMVIPESCYSGDAMPALPLK